MGEKRAHEKMTAMDAEDRARQFIRHRRPPEKSRRINNKARRKMTKQTRRIRRGQNHIKRWIHIADDWTEKEQKEMANYLKKLLREEAPKHKEADKHP